MKNLVWVVLFAVAVPMGSARSETAMERGAYLVNGIVACGNCHTPQGPTGPVPGKAFAGQKLLEEPVMTVYAPNITPDAETGVGHYTREDMKRAIREGLRPDGSIIGPPMPIGLYRGLSDTDLDAIVTYVMSVDAVRNELPRSTYKIPLPPEYGPPVSGVADIDRTDTLAYGAYLAGALGHCIECHTPFAGGTPDFENRFGAGGAEFPGPWGVSVAANITPHPTDGIARYSDAELKAIIQTGERPDGTRLLPPMGFAYYAQINDDDMDALIAYLRSLAPLPFGG